MIILEAFGRNDFERLIAWTTSEEMLLQFGGPLFSFPLTAGQLDNYVSDDSRRAYKVIELPDLEVIGHAELIRTGEKTIKLCRILIGEATKRGHGLGGQIINALLTISFSEFGAQSVELNVYDWNEQAIKCYEKAGFILNPDKTFQSKVNGKIWKAINMTIDKSRWTPV